MKRIFLLILIGYLPMLAFSQDNNHFTIIGKTKNYQDSTKLYFRKYASGSLSDNQDSTYVINNAFILTGTVPEPHKYQIHTGYTGWEAEPPESYHSISFWVDNTTIYLTDDVGNLKYSKIAGAELQQDNNDFNQTVAQLIAYQDSLWKVMMELSPSDTSKINLLRNERRESFKKEELLYMDLIKSHPRSIISAYILNIYKTTWGRDKTLELFRLLDESAQNTPYGAPIKEYIQLTSNIEVGDSFVDLELNDLNGDPIKLSSFKGNYILLDFWASYCGPCRAEHPRLLELYNKYKEKGFEIYAVCLDDNKESWQQTVKQDKISWITVSELKQSTESKSAMIYGITALPQNYLIDKQGKIIAKNIRGEELADKLDEIFNKQQ